MSVASTLTKVQYPGNGSTVTPYPTQFKFYDNSWVRVQVLSAAGIVTDLALGSGFTLSGVNDPDGGEVVTVAAVPVDSTVTIYRVVDITQLLNLAYNDRLPAVLLEGSLDKITFILQQLAGDNASGDRSVRFPPSEPAANNVVLPVPVERRDTVLFFDPITGEMLTLRLDQLAQRLLSILGAEAFLPYRTREINASLAVEQEDYNTVLRAVSAVDEIEITLPPTEGFNDNFFCGVARFGNGPVRFIPGPGVILEGEESDGNVKVRLQGSKKPTAAQIIGSNRWWIYGDLY